MVWSHKKTLIFFKKSLVWSRSMNPQISILYSGYTQPISARAVPHATADDFGAFLDYKWSILCFIYSCMCFFFKYNINNSTQFVFRLLTVDLWFRKHNMWFLWLVHCDTILLRLLQTFNVVTLTSYFNLFDQLIIYSCSHLQSNYSTTDVIAYYVIIVIIVLRHNSIICTYSSWEDLQKNIAMKNVKSTRLPRSTPVENDDTKKRLENGGHGSEWSSDPFFGLRSWQWKRGPTGVSLAIKRRPSRCRGGSFPIREQNIRNVDQRTLVHEIASRERKSRDVTTCRAHVCAAFEGPDSDFPANVTGSLTSLSRWRNSFARVPLNGTEQQDQRRGWGQEPRPGYGRSRPGLLPVDAEIGGIETPTFEWGDEAFRFEQTFAEVSHERRTSAV